MTPEELNEEQRIKDAAFRSFFEATVALLFRHDPLPHDGDDEINHDEYALEAQQILGGLRSCSSQADLTHLAHRVFVSWNGEDAGPLERYENIGKELWELWGNHAA